MTQLFLDPRYRKHVGPNITFQQCLVRPRWLDLFPHITMTFLLSITKHGPVDDISILSRKRPGASIWHRGPKRCDHIQHPCCDFLTPFLPRTPTWVKSETSSCYHIAPLGFTISTPANRNIYCLNHGALPGAPRWNNSCRKFCTPLVLLEQKCCTAAIITFLLGGW